ncbi:N-acetylglucosamine-6-phosphate deacetylase [Paenibacillus shirakamiensis]|uniref:N-acetylglucosamine-6-phosphate deacetylase n=1 Tax=Paenibacillus shirakamiensis TaxID=1265935 RepID=A0ABS4JDX5_9BACL|nr:N-acetylglucosamine-6-phosphate deacetylase [Paenibacillus shirakamiensis]MBP1999932.1 N-acetylglucosamine-6-phosphate deacetylase [Paenibacillus shirakamiensis]
MSSSSFLLKNCTLFIDDKITYNANLLIVHGKIHSIHEDDELDIDVETWDMQGKYVFPGFVDIHVHGAHGQTFNSSSVEIWEDIMLAHALAGSTTLLPTVMTDTKPNMLQALAVGTDLNRQGRVAGIHLEGPYLNFEQRGAHDAKDLLLPQDDFIESLRDYFHAIKLVTLAPELEGMSSLIQTLHAHQIIVSAGHSVANAQVIERSKQIGLSHFTHLWSGQTLLTKHGPWRNLGLIDIALSSENMTAEMIADGFHLPEELVKIAYRCLGKDRLCLISDASAGTGLPQESHFVMGSSEGIVKEGVALSVCGNSFCGSTSFLTDIFRFCVHKAGIPIAEAVQMATSTPAKIIGIDHIVGRIEPGRNADLLIMNEDLTVYSVLQQGVKVKEKIRSYDST